MINFKQIDIADGKWMRPIAAVENSRSADFNFVSNYLWKNSFKHMVGRLEDRYVIKVTLPMGVYYSFPIGQGDLKQAYLDIKKDADEHGIPVKICGAMEYHIQQLRECGITDFRVEPMTAANDYIYAIDDLADLKGKKFHGKRNHIHRFEETQDWHYEELTVDHIEVCRKMLDVWMKDYEEVTDSLKEEFVAVNLALDHFSILELEGGVLYVGDEVVAFTIGDVICADTVEVNFEKARRDIEGSYPMINREFVRMIRKKHPQIRYINREDDMGNENLRKAKQSYHPVFMIEKNNLIFES